MRLELGMRELRLREPMPTAWGVLERRRILLVRLEASDGLVGHGEAAPLEPYDGVSLETVREQVEACAGLLAPGEPRDRAELLEACRQRGCHAQAVAALDLALWDLEGRRASRPVSTLLAEAPLSGVPVNATIGAVEPSHAAERARAAAAAGFGCVKVKAGTEGDRARIAAVRAAVGPKVAIRVDANGAWTVGQALDNLRELDATGIELCEEPVHGVAEMAAVRRGLEGRVPIAMDETAAQPGALSSGAADAVCLKIASSGGITGLLNAAARARAAGTEVYLASTFDGPVGVAAAVHVAAALRVRRPCGLATLDLFADFANRLPVSRGAIAVPTAAGLGVS